MTIKAKLPPLESILELVNAGESYEAIGARFGVGGDAVSQALTRARRRGQLPPLPPRVAPEPAPTRRATGVGDLNITPRSNNPRGPAGDRHLPPPADGPVCGAQQILGSRVCDQAPHDLHKKPCVGEGDLDARAEFWGRRT